MIGFEERFAGGIGFDDQAILLQHVANRLADVTVVVDDKDCGRRGTGCLVAGERSARAQPGARGREEPLNNLRQLLYLHWLVQLDAVLKRDIAEDVGGNIAGQNNDWNRMVKFLPQLCDELEAVEAIGKVVVRDNEVRPDGPANNEFEGCNAVTRRRGAMALFLQQEFENFAYVGIVLDDEITPLRRTPSLAPSLIPLL